MTYFNAQHYAKVKSICDWLWTMDKHSNYKEVYVHWGEMSNEERVIELEYLETILNEYIENEEDKAYIRSFKSAIEDVVKIQEELVNE